MKQIHSQPPNWQKLITLFGADWNKTVVTYGENVYCRHPLPEDLVAHESVHVTQQTEYPGGPDAWWERYYVDKQFRLDQELEAYRAQHAFVCSRTKDRNFLFKFRDAIARDLSSKMYGSVISHTDAFCLVAQKGKAVAA